MYPYLLHGAQSFLRSTGSQIVKKFPAFYGTRRFITAFTSACHLSLSWSSSIQSMPPHPTSWRSISIFFSPVRLGLQSVQVRGFLCERFVIWYVFSTSPKPQAGRPPLYGCPRLFVQCIRSYAPHWRPFLHPQPEVATCRGDRDTFITENGF
jgi:hypothetical protein